MAHDAISNRQRSRPRLQTPAVTSPRRVNKEKEFGCKVRRARAISFPGNGSQKVQDALTIQWFADQTKQSNKFLGFSVVGLLYLSSPNCGGRSVQACQFDYFTKCDRRVAFAIQDSANPHRNVEGKIFLASVVAGVFVSLITRCALHAKSVGNARHRVPKVVALCIYILFGRTRVLLVDRNHAIHNHFELLRVLLILSDKVNKYGFVTARSMARVKARGWRHLCK